MKKNILITTILLLMSCIAPVSKPDVSTNNFRIEKESRHLSYITGEIKNNGDTKIKGYVKIKYLDNNLDIIGNTKAKVNDGDFIAAGQRVSIKIATDPKELENVVDFQIKFIEK